MIARRYPLTGLITCSLCGQKLMGSGGTYRCVVMSGGCGKIDDDGERSCGVA
jgi:hypothetical protein